MDTKGKYKSFEVDISDGEDVGDDNHSIDSFREFMWDSEEDPGLGNDAAAPIDDQNGISFAQDDDAEFTNDDDLPQGYEEYEDYDAAHSPTEPQGFDEHADADLFPNDAEDEYEEVPERSKKRRRTTAAAPSKSAQPAQRFSGTTEAERSAKRATTNGSRSFVIDDEADKGIKGPSSKQGIFGRTNRGKNNRLPAYARRVTHDLDSADELIMNMRDKGFSDQQVSDRLKKEGRVQYSAKSISTRISRIKCMQGERWEFELENGMREWKMEDDRLLLRAYDLAGIEIAYEIERQRSWRWKKTSEWMHRMNKDLLFTGPACQKRYAALMDGTAAIPSDVDADPAQRKAEMEQLRQDREDERQKEAEDKEAEEVERQRLQEEEAIRSSERAVKNAEKKSSRYIGRQARAAERANQSIIRSQKAEENLRRKLEMAEARQKIRDDKEAERKHRDEFAVKNFKHITKDSPDPRRGLDIPDLQKLCRERKISDDTPYMTDLDAKKVLLRRLQTADEALRHCHLVAMCQGNKIPTGGNKLQMCYQLALFAARGCDSYADYNVSDYSDDEAEVLEQEFLEQHEFLEQEFLEQEFLEAENMEMENMEMENVETAKMEMEDEEMDHAGSPEVTQEIM